MTVLAWQLKALLLCSVCVRVFVCVKRVTCDIAPVEQSDLSVAYLVSGKVVM